MARDNIEELVSKWRRWAERSDRDEADQWAEGYNAALRTCAEELEAQHEYNSS